MRFGYAALALLALSFGRPVLCATPGADHAEATYYADAYADHYGVPRYLVHAIIAQESGWNPKGVSDKGAMGLMQLMPSTATRFNVANPYSISDNIGGGVRYLAQLTAQFKGDYRLVVAAYYCGSKNLSKRGLAYSNSDVVAYVRSVRARYIHELRQADSVPSTIGGNE
jgi:soluble lytic murein transglycosylase-like protein